MADTISASQIIGKQLLAKKKVAIYRLPDDSQKPVFYVEPGNPIGIVYSYLKLDPTKNRKFLYWQFMDSNGKPYYTRHAENLIDLKSLKDQGVKSVKQETQENQQKDFGYYFKEYGKPVLIGIAVTYIGSKLLTKYL